MASRFYRSYRFAGQTNGRPRVRCRVSDFPVRIDALAIRRDAIREGRNLLDITAVGVQWTDGGVAHTERIVVVAMPDQVYRAKLLLVCPRCCKRRMHLYPMRTGVACRACGRVR